MEDEEGTRAIPAVWIGAEQLPVTFVNQFLGIVHTGEVFLHVGTLEPPGISGETVEERKAQAEALQFVPITPVARLAVSIQGLRELARVIDQTMQNYEAHPGNQP